MPSYRVTDAAHVVPYLTHTVSHHGQVTLVPPDNAGRVREVKSARSTRTSRPRQDRPTRPEEDIKFNTGPRSFRSLLSRRSRGRDQGFEDPGKSLNHTRLINRRVKLPKAYPNYPPPSFDEATSSPLIPGPSSTVEPYATAPQHATTSHHPSTLPSTSFAPASGEPVPPISGQVTADEVESDTSSLEIVDSEEAKAGECPPSGSRLEEQVKQDWVNRRGVEFPSPERGRTKSRTRAIDLDPEDASEEPQSGSPQETPKRRHLSLSPLRTLFPYRPMAIPEGPFSAHPSHSSPYSRSPFASAHSLKMSMSTTSFGSFKGESFLSRRLLSFKGKEQPTSEELLGEWEVMTEDTDSVPLDPAVSRWPPPAPKSPTRNQSFSSRKPATPLVKANIRPSIETPPPAKAKPVPPVKPVPVPPVEVAPPVEQTPTSPHPLSLRDRKAPPVPVVRRPRAKRKSPPPPPVVPSAPLGPILTSVRTRNPSPPPLPKKPPQIHIASPLGQTSWRRSTDSGDLESNSILQRALLTPLPPTPIQSHHADAPTTPITPLRESAPDSKPLSLQETKASPIAISIAIADPPASETLLSPLTGDFPIPSFTLQRTASASVTDPSLESSPSLRRHYAGRPLPRPPGTTRALVDSTYSGYPDSPITFETQISSPCPEGLLIDLEDDSLDQTPTASSSPWISGTGLVMQPYAASSTSSVELLGSITDVSVPLQREISREATRSTELPSAQVPPTHSSAAPFAEITDLDVIVSRMHDEGEPRDGSNYDDLLLLSEFIGPATAVRNIEATSQDPSHSTPVPNHAETVHSPPNIPLLGAVEVARRRTTKDGRVMLKLVLIDASACIPREVSRKVAGTKKNVPDV
ncbi:hypothetical protein H0H81_007557 [Sphagnurus paluster]|uniref:Uncharacterized protein n=1 Tax=Sphagnurus paluster TaxID=117069 RepID=A0A9P7K692_9AGAR|nr:hypothetical protein H0H81_007557 [Sphagnurus paluster]